MLETFDGVDGGMSGNDRNDRESLFVATCTYAVQQRGSTNVAVVYSLVWELALLNADQI